MTVLMVLLLSAALVIIDQLLKLWALNALVGVPSALVIPGLLQLTYVENRGAAFGIFQGRVPILSLVTGVVLTVILVALVLGKFKNKLVLWSMGLILAGGLGNLLDRIFRGFVVDYLDISPLFSFPVFNFADCCVVIGTGLLMIYLLFLEGKEPKPAPAASDAPPHGEPDGE